MRYAWQRLLRGGAVLVPSGASVWGQLVSSDELSYHDLSQVHTAVLDFFGGDDGKCVHIGTSSRWSWLDSDRNVPTCGVFLELYASYHSGQSGPTEKHAANQGSVYNEQHW